jgi:hypothetical protein
MIQPNTIPGSLSWSHINSREYQLRGEGRVLATLKIDDDLDASMAGKDETRRWTFKRMGLFKFSVSVLAECEGTDCATLVESSAGEYQVFFPGGESLRWKRTLTSWQEEWGFFDSAGMALIVFVPKVIDSECRASVQVSAAGHALSNLDLLVLLGWYIFVSKYRDAAWKSTMITAMAWGAT